MPDDECTDEYAGKGQYWRPDGIKGVPRFPKGSWYRYENGRMYNGLMAVGIALSDVKYGDGGFCCIPGSHKGNLLPPLEVRRLDTDLGMVQQIPMKAGSICVFTECLTHGTLPWQADYERRALIYRYNPTWLGRGPELTSDALRLQEEAWEALRPVLHRPLQVALMEPPWVSTAGASPGEEGGRPDIAGHMREAETMFVGDGGRVVHTLSRM